MTQNSSFNISLIGIACMLCLPITAQDIITVEKEYSPEISAANRSDFVPKVIIAAGDTSDIPFAIPQNNNHRQVSAPLLYDAFRSMSRLKFNAGAGTYGQTETGLYLNPNLGNNDKLQVAADYSGVYTTRSMDAPYEYRMQSGSQHPRWYNHDFNTQALLDYTHTFNTMAVGVIGDIGIHNFSYYHLPLAANDFTANQSDRHYGIALHATPTSSYRLPLRVSVDAGYAAFRRSHIPTSDYTLTFLRENKVFANVDMSARDGNSTYGIGVDAAHTSYNTSIYDDFTTIEANPYYTLYKDQLILRLGGKVLYSFGLKPYIQLAPDVKAEYVIAEDIALFAQATGGQRSSAEQDPRAMYVRHVPSTYSIMSALQPYAMPAGQLRNPFANLRSAMGIKGNPSPTFSFAVQGGYDIVNNDVCITGMDDQETGLAYLKVANHDTYRFYGQANVEFYLPRSIRLSLQAVANSWSNQHHRKNLTKPTVQLGSQFAFPVTDKLSVNVSYNYESYSKVSLLTNRDYRMSAINNLSAEIGYAIHPKASIYVSGRNLLNATYNDYYAYPALHLNVLAGVRIEL